MALPLLRLREPSTTLPSMKVTVPVGVPEPATAALTLAVRVIDWPKVDVASDVLSFVLLALTTCWVSGEVLPPKLPSSLV